MNDEYYNLTEKMARTLFNVAGFHVSNVHELKNLYGSESYHGSWWLMITPHGPIRIGWRKRVIEINWTDTHFRGIITEDILRNSIIWFIHGIS